MCVSARKMRIFYTCTIYYRSDGIYPHSSQQLELVSHVKPFGAIFCGRYFVSSFLAGHLDVISLLLLEIGGKVTGLVCWCMRPADAKRGTC